MTQTLQNPANHSCRYCQPKSETLQSLPRLQFRSPTLRQNALLRVAYMTFAVSSDKTKIIDSLPLPIHLVDEIKAIHEEIRRWDEDTSKLYRMLGKKYNFRHRDIEHDFESSLQWTDFRCFLVNLHWVPGGNMIDRRATAYMILQCDLGFDRRKEFLLAAANCLESEVARLWPLLDADTRERWPSNYYCAYSQSPIVMYWISKQTNNPGRIDRALQDMTSYCVRHGNHEFVTLKYFWPKIVGCMGGIHDEKMKRLFDHALHEAIYLGNRPATFFIWNEAPKENYCSMISAERCCGARNYYYTFQRAVELGDYEIVRLMWDSMDTKQCNRVLLAEHGKAFCRAAELGFLDIVRLFWYESTFNQRFILLFEQTCLAFRLACASGHMSVVQLLWENATADQRRQLLIVSDCDAMTMPCKNGHLDVVRYLWENMGDELKVLMDSLMENSMMLSKCICETSLLVTTDAFKKAGGPDGGKVLRYLFSISNVGLVGSDSWPVQSQLVHALLFCDAAALKALVKRGEITGNWREISDLFSKMESRERAQLCAKMTTEKASLCGLVPVVDHMDGYECQPLVVSNDEVMDCV